MAKKTHKVPKNGWRSRIVGQETVAAGQLLAHEDNWKVHGRPQQSAMRALLGHELGWLQSVIVNKRSGKVIDGHMRVQVALTNGEDTPVPVTYVDLSPKEERLALLSFDQVGAAAGRNDEAYDALLVGVTDLTEDLAGVLVRKKRAKGLSHTVKECTCCKTKCQPGCGCHRDA